MSKDFTTSKDNLNNIEIPIEKQNLAIGNAIEKGKQEQQGTIEPTKGKRFKIKPFWKKVAFSVSGLSLLLGTVVVVNPSVQAFSTDLMSKIFPYYKTVIKDGRYELEKRDGEDLVENYPNIKYENIYYETLKDVEQQMGVLLKLPSYLPDNSKQSFITGVENLKLASFHYITNSVKWAIHVDSSQNAKNITREGTIINEKFKIGDTLVYVEKKPQYFYDETNQTPRVESINSISWSDQQGVLYVIIGDLAIEEMKKIAKSMIQ